MPASNPKSKAKAKAKPGAKSPSRKPAEPGDVPPPAGQPHADLNAELVAAKVENTKLNDQLTAKTQQSQGLESQLAAARQEIQELKDQLAGASKDLADKTGALTLEQERTQNLKAQVAAMTDQSSQMQQSELQKLRDEAERLGGESTTMQHSEIKRLGEEVSRLGKENACLRKEKADQENDIVDMKTQVQELKEWEETIQREIDNALKNQETTQAEELRRLASMTEDVRRQHKEEDTRQCDWKQDFQKQLEQHEVLWHAEAEKLWNQLRQTARTVAITPSSEAFGDSF